MPSLVEKDLRIAAEPKKFFTEPHYNGYPAVLVRLSEVRVPELRELLTEAWRCQAPKALVKQVEGRAMPAKRKQTHRKKR